ncbi:MAG TPA: hypothetical protein VF606_09985, partial [Geminicoccaceae bacterium]
PPITAEPQPPAVTPPAETATAPPPPPPPPVAPEPDRAAVQAALASVPCSTIEATLEPGGRVRLTGTAAHEELVAEARDKVAAVADVATVDEGGLTVAAAPGCYGAVRLERAVAAAGGAASMPELGLNKPDGIYFDQDFLIIQAAMPPGLGGHLYVDVLTDAGAVYHLLPEELTPDNALPAGGRIRIGVEAAERRQGVRDWQAAPPFGPAYMVAVASERPLLPGLREVEEPAAGYVDILLKALAETPGAKAVRVQRVEFRPRP